MKYRLNEVESLQATINHVAKTKVIGGREIVTYDNYITLVPNKVYTTDDRALFNSLINHREEVRWTQAIEDTLKRHGINYEIKHCPRCGGRVKKISYQLVEAVDE